MRPNWAGDFMRSRRRHLQNESRSSLKIGSRKRRRDDRLRNSSSYFFMTFGGNRQSNLPLPEETLTSTSATPAFASLSDAPVRAEIGSVKSGSCPTSINLY